MCDFHPQLVLTSHHMEAELEFLIRDLKSVEINIK